MRIEEIGQGTYIKRLEPHERQLVQVLFELQQSIEAQFGELMRRIDDLEQRVEELEQQNA